MPDEPPAEEQAVSTIDTVIVVPVAEEPEAQIDYAGAIALLQERVTALEAARVKDSNDDGSDDDGADGADGADEAETGKDSEERQRPVTRHWLFGKLGG